VRYHEYVQWLADSQLQSLAWDAADRGVSLYFDLPIGASRDSYDVWRQRSLFAERASVGAPRTHSFPRARTGPSLRRTLMLSVPKDTGISSPW
jgi:hypothetical protein